MSQSDQIYPQGTKIARQDDAKIEPCYHDSAKYTSQTHLESVPRAISNKQFASNNSYVVSAGVYTSQCIQLANIMYRPH